MPRAGTWNCQLAVALDFDPELSHVRLYHAFQIANSSLVLQHWGMISFIHDLALNIGARNKRLRERRGPWNTSCILDLLYREYTLFLRRKMSPVQHVPQVAFALRIQGHVEVCPGVHRTCTWRSQEPPAGPSFAA